MKYVLVIVIVHALLACSQSDIDAESAGKEVLFELKWGGYYAMREGKGHYRVFRLMDFTTHTLDISWYRESFVYRPSLEEVAELTPFVQFYAIDTRTLLNQREIHLLGYHALTQDDIEGFRSYKLIDVMDTVATEKRVKVIVDLSKQPPRKLRLNLVDDEVVITDP
jgi:hypothetical protein